MQQGFQRYGGKKLLSGIQTFIVEDAQLLQPGETVRFKTYTAEPDSLTVDHEFIKCELEKLPQLMGADDFRRALESILDRCKTDEARNASPAMTMNFLGDYQ